MGLVVIEASIYGYYRMGFYCMTLLYCKVMLFVKMLAVLHVMTWLVIKNQSHNVLKCNRYDKL